jgi:hypothetical protein
MNGVQRELFDGDRVAAALWCAARSVEERIWVCSRFIPGFSDMLSAADADPFSVQKLPPQVATALVRCSPPHVAASLVRYGLNSLLQDAVLEQLEALPVEERDRLLVAVSSSAQGLADRVCALKLSPSVTLAAGWCALLTAEIDAAVAACVSEESAWSATVEHVSPNWQRFVRNFKTDPISDEVLDVLLQVTALQSSLALLEQVSVEQWRRLASRFDLGLFVSMFADVTDVEFIDQHLARFAENGPGVWLTSQGAWSARWMLTGDPDLVVAFLERCFPDDWAALVWNRVPVPECVAVRGREIIVEVVRQREFDLQLWATMLPEHDAEAVTLSLAEVLHEVPSPVMSLFDAGYMSAVGRRLLDEQLSDEQLSAARAAIEAGGSFATAMHLASVLT